MRVLRKDWSDLIEGKTSEGSSMKEIKLNLEEDPTAKSVLPTKPPEGEAPVKEEDPNGKLVSVPGT